VDLILTNLAPGRTSSIQLYQRGTNTAVGSPIAGTSSIYDYIFPSIPLGDFDYSLIGFTALPGSRRAIRSTSIYVYEAANWWEIDTSISNGVPIVPSPITGLCNVTVAVTANGTPVVGAVATAVLDSKINTVDQYLVSRAIASATTNSEGLCILRLIQFGQFTEGGKYRIRVSDQDGKSLYDKTLAIPNLSATNLEAIV
jgi:hypothetical protein